MEELIHISDMIYKLKKKTSENDTAFCSLGSELFASIVFACLPCIVDINEDEMKRCARLYCELYLLADDDKKREDFFESLIKLVHICGETNTEVQKANYKKNVDNIVYRIKRIERESILPESMRCGDDRNISEIIMNTEELFIQHNNSIRNIDFLRLDLTVKYLFIEYSHGLNDDGLILYEKLQRGRLKEVKSKFTDESLADFSCVFFRDLIYSFETTGYDENSFITCNNELMLLDGSHRLALCLYYGIPNVSVRVIRDEHSIPLFTEQNLIKYGFTKEELNRVKNKTKQLILGHFQPFCCILWPPASEYFDVIEDYINKKCCNVLSSYNYELSKEIFTGLFRDMYEKENTGEIKINNIIDIICKMDNYKVRILNLAFYSPQFRLSEKNNDTFSSTCKNLEDYLRLKWYCLMPNYICDFVVNIATNYSHNKYLNDIIKSIME